MSVHPEDKKYKMRIEELSAIMEPLFVYGTLKDSAIQEKVIGRVVAGLEDVLEGYDLSTIDIGNEMFPVVVGKAGSSVEGLVLSVTPNELARIDLYETEAYQRKKVMLRSGKECWVYEERLIK